MIKPLNITNKRFFRWSKSAIECYNRGCVCVGCPVNKILETHCMMKSTVLLLVKKIGKPNE